jgi:hypothetical protein
MLYVAFSLFPLAPLFPLFLTDALCVGVPQQFIGVVHEQSKYWKVTDLCLDHLIRMAKKSRAVLDWLVANPKYLDNMIGWLHTYPEPPAAVPAYLRDREPAEAQAIVLLKPAPERSYVSSVSSSMYGALMSVRGNIGAAMDVDRDTNASVPSGISPVKKMEALQAIKAGTALDNENATDSDVDFSERSFKFGEYVDCADTVNKWLVAQIVRIDGHRVEVWLPPTHASLLPPLPLLLTSPPPFSCRLLRPVCRCTSWVGLTNGMRRWMWLTRASVRWVSAPPPNSALRPNSRSTKAETPATLPPLLSSFLLSSPCCCLPPQRA